mmetsp:Transcript_12398/g.38299  ORF Transcript_12398/g.38299 Transcript_12398/m.38299 type:complete len:252 (+) Transcript_12398:318-1073(+)
MAKHAQTCSASSLVLHSVQMPWQNMLKCALRLHGRCRTGAAAGRLPKLPSPSACPGSSACRIGHLHRGGAIGRARWLGPAQPRCMLQRWSGGSRRGRTAGHAGAACGSMGPGLPISGAPAPSARPSPDAMSHPRAPRAAPSAPPAAAEAAPPPCPDSESKALPTMQPPVQSSVARPVTDGGTVRTQRPLCSLWNQISPPLHPVWMWPPLRQHTHHLYCHACQPRPIPRRPRHPRGGTLLQSVSSLVGIEPK